LGSDGRPRSEISLKCGATAVLRSHQKLCMPPDISGIGFPPSSKVSLAGLLSTNPGHVDPDYKGFLHLTVVNMGKEPFGIKRGDRMMRLLLFRLSDMTSFRLDEMASPVNQELLDRLSSDFMDVERRGQQIAQKIVQDAEVKIKSRQVWIPLVVGSVAAVASIVVAVYTILTGQAELKTTIARMEGRFNTIGTTINLGQIESRLNELTAINERVKSLEASKQVPASSQPGQKQ
jgi:dCTP deaminase